MLSLFAADAATPAGFLTPEIVAGVFGVLGILARHYIPALKKILPTRSTDPATPPVNPTPAGVAAKAVTDALTWAVSTQVAKATAGLKLGEADITALKALDGVIHSLLAENPK